LVSWDLANS